MQLNVESLLQKEGQEMLETRFRLLHAEELEKLTVEELEQLLKEAKRAYREKERRLESLVEVEGGAKN
jgi:hypothetical protein